MAFFLQCFSTVSLAIANASYLLGDPA